MTTAQTPKVQPRGLSTAEAEEIRGRSGLNEIPAPPSLSQWRRFGMQFRNPLIYLLLLSAVATAALQHWVDTSVILFVVLTNAAIGFFQEYKAETTLAGIRRLLPLNALVLRDGQAVKLPASELVPGDAVIIAAGDRVPADISLRDANGLKAEESLLTGESLDCEKSADSPEAATKTLYSGSHVTGGSGWGIVVATGKSTEIGRISGDVAEVEAPVTPLTRRITSLSRYIVATVIFVIIAAFIFGTFVRQIPLGEMLMILIGIAVSAVPEGLPAAMSVILALGIGRMARRKAIIRRLPVVETLGNLTVICTDKTGTLTINALMVDHVVTSAATISVTGSGYSPVGDVSAAAVSGPSPDAAFSALVLGCVLNNDAILRVRNDVWTMNGDPTEGALLALAGKAGAQAEALRTAFPRMAVIPFDAEHKYMATLHRAEGDENFIWIKGAPEVLLPICRLQMKGSGDIVPLDIEYWTHEVDGLARKGRRVLALARKAVGKAETLNNTDLTGDIVILGLLGIADQARPEAKESILLCQRAGIAVKMITGDHPVTASAIGAEVGLADPSSVLTGAELEHMDDAALGRAAASVNIFARMRPAHKLRLVKALQADGMIVAMTGDGVNDAPALRAADVGIAMGLQGSEVAKDAAGIVLADDNFSTIAAAVEEGRNVYSSLRLAIQFMIITDVAEGFSLLASLFLGLPQPIAPLQILWVNTVTSITLSMVFAFLPRSKEVMSLPPVPPGSTFYDRKTLILFAAQMLVMSVGTICVFLTVMAVASDEALARTSAVNAIISFQVWYLIAVYPRRREAGEWLRHYTPLLIGTGALAFLQYILCYTATFRDIFHTTSLPPSYLAGIISFTFVIALVQKRRHS